MRRTTKKILVLAIGTLFTFMYCEILIYYASALQCTWPTTSSTNSSQIVKAFVLADIHMLGPRKGHWLDKWRREWQMHRAYQSILSIHQPDVVFILGDLFDEGEWSNNKQFEEYVERFYKLFSVPDHTKLYVAVGNHDIGFHNYISRNTAEKFTKAFKSPPVQFIKIKGNYFVLINSMAMHGDSCHLCTEARRDINEVSGKLECFQDASKCRDMETRLSYSRPILMQHFPLYRSSDGICTGPDAPPLPERNKPFRLKIDSLSQEATEYLVNSLRPRAVFGGHTHHGCLVHHKTENGSTDFREYSVPSFSWRNRPDPLYMLVTFSPETYAVSKCWLPRETTIALSAVVLMFIVLSFIISKRTIGR